MANPRSSLARLLGAGLVLGAAAFASLSGRWPWRRFDLPSRPSLAVAGRPITLPAREAAFVERADTLRRGETLSHLFERQGVQGLDLGTIASHLDPRRLRAGLVFTFRRAAPDSSPSELVVRTGPEQRVEFRRIDSGWAAVAQPIRWTPEVIRVEGDIDNSLYEALDAQVPSTQLAGPERERLAWDLADVFAWQVDFTRDIQPGDHFQVVLERLVSEEGEIRFGRVLASDLTVGGRHVTAFRFGPDGKSAFYDSDGNSLRRAFLRAPVEFRRISSNFSRGRLHPVLGYARKHEGTDYAAAPGTPVMAAGDGVVLRAGRAGGYGNLVELRHRNGIITRYGHLRAFARGIHAGGRVSQGQFVGFVGSTGLATGPHLHYEFRVNGAAVDSRRAALGNGAPIDRRDRAAFDVERERLAATLYPAGRPQIAQRKG
jgi:murein DD-endopeptidase MepM/ murein hydrolase activator NlpD